MLIRNGNRAHRGGYCYELSALRAYAAVQYVAAPATTHWHSHIWAAAAVPVLTILAPGQVARSWQWHSCRENNQPHCLLLRRIVLRRGAAWRGFATTGPQLEASRSARGSGPRREAETRKARRRACGATALRVIHQWLRGYRCRAAQESPACG